MAINLFFFLMQPPFMSITAQKDASLPLPQISRVEEKTWVGTDWVFMCCCLLVGCCGFCYCSFGDRTRRSPTYKLVLLRAELLYFPPLSSAMIGKTDISCFPAETWQGLLWAKDCWKPVCHRESPAGRPFPTSRSRTDHSRIKQEQTTTAHSQETGKAQVSQTHLHRLPGIWMQTCMCVPFRGRGCLSAGVHGSLKIAVINLLCLYLVWFYFVLILSADIWLKFLKAFIM